MNIGLIVTFAGIIVAALAGVLGVWMERDRTAPTHWAWVFSAFILVAMCVELGHSVVQASEDSETDAAMVRVLEQLTEIAAEGNNPALEQFVGAELALQARANPELVAQLEENIEAKGGDATTIRTRAIQGRRTAAGLPARPGKAGAATVGAGFGRGRSGAASVGGGIGRGKAGSSGIGGKPGAAGIGSKPGAASIGSKPGAASIGGSDDSKPGAASIGTGAGGSKPAASGNTSGGTAPRVGGRNRNR